MAAPPARDAADRAGPGHWGRTVDSAQLSRPRVGGTTARFAHVRAWRADIRAGLSGLRGRPENKSVQFNNARCNRCDPLGELLWSTAHTVLSTTAARDL